jgi:catechol 2,3-dioxygenase-like lactoylglutathione lyase family enzyme
MAMRPSNHVTLVGLLIVTPACSDLSRPVAAVADQCSVADAYETRTIFDFEGGGDSGWFAYTDHTPGGVPNLPDGSSSNVPLATLDPPRCGSTTGIEFRAFGNNYWGAGFGDWAHNSSPADGTGYQGISFWARSPGNTDKTFMFKVDDGQTFVKVATPPWPAATAADQDLNQDGILDPGDIASGTRCRLAPPQSVGDPNCYYGGTQAPTAVSRVPEPGECGNPFHTYVTTTEEWRLYLIPWSDLVQWPCPNRVAGGIDPSDIRKLEFRLIQGTNYDIWLDDINFYRLRGNAGAGS